MKIVIDRLDLSQKLKNARLEMGLTQAQVAEVLGYDSPQFISNWERGLSLPPLTVLFELSALYNIPSEEFVDLLTAEVHTYIQDVKKSIRKDIEKIQKRRDKMVSRRPGG